MGRATLVDLDNIGGVTRASALVHTIASQETAVSRQQIHITLAGRELAMDAGTTAADALFMPNETGGAPSPSTVIAARVNGAPPVPFGIKIASPAVVPASITSSRPARVM